MGSWKGRGNQYIQFVRVLYCKLPTNGKQLPAFPLEVMLGIEPRPQRWEAKVLPLCHRGPDKCLKNVDCVIEEGRKGILCPLCRKFTSEPNIKKDPILEVLVEVFSQYYDQTILNKDPTEKSCNQ